MITRWRSLLALLGVSIALGLAAQSVAQAKKLPPPPKTYVLDEPEITSPEVRYALQTLLSEHAHLTGEQVVFAVFKSLDGEDLVEWTNRIFAEWKIGAQGKDNGVLLALYWNDRKARIEVGYGLEPLLTDAKAKRILTEALIPELKRQQPDRGLTLAAWEILRVLGSPLIQSGKAEQILREGGFQGDFVRQNPPIGSTGGGTVWVVLILFVGFALFIIVTHLLTARDAHFTSRGWYRPNPIRTNDWHPFSSGWGEGGRGGWGGGFSGGGGRSGGGGASGSW